MDSRANFEYAPTRPEPAEQLLTASDSGSWHDQKRQAAYNAIRSKLRDNHVKEKYYLSNPNQHYLSNVGIKTSFQGHKDPASLSGGVFTSKAGQEYGRTRLKERVNELNVRASAAFGAETPQAQPSSLPKQPVAVAIDDAYTALFDAVQSVEFTNFVPNAKTVLTKLYDGGAELGSSKVGDYNTYTADIRQQLVGLLNGPEVDVPAYRRDRLRPTMDTTAEYRTAIQEGRTPEPIPVGIRGIGPARKRNIQQALSVMDRIARLLDLIARTVNLAANERKLAIDNARSRDVAEAAARNKVNPVNAPDISVPPAYPGSNQGVLSTPGPGDVRGLSPTGLEGRTVTQQAFQSAEGSAPYSSGPSSRRSSGSDFSFSPTSSDIARGDSGPAIMGLNAANGRGKKGKKAIATEASRILAMLDDLADNPKKKNNIKKRS
jgi:hypothetical protein